MDRTSQASAQELREEGNACYRKGDHAAAQQHYLRALDLAPNDSSLLCNLSVCSLQLGRSEEAKQYAERAIATDPTNAKARFRLGEASNAMHDLPGAFESYRSGLSLLPGDRALCEKLVGCVAALPHKPANGEKVFEIVETSDRGQAVFATVDISPGMLVLQDTQILAARRSSGSYGRIRCFYDECRKKNDRVWQVFQLACPRSAIPEGRQRQYQKEGEKIIKQLKLELGDDYEEFVSVDQAVQLLITFDVNGVGNSHGNLTSLFMTASRFEHSCDPNCCFYFPFADTIAIYCTRAVRRGEALSISYSHLHLPTEDRRFALQQSYFFKCRCALCEGPDVARAFSCPKEGCGGVVHPPAGGSSGATCMGAMSMGLFSSATTNRQGCAFCGTATCFAQVGAPVPKPGAEEGEWRCTRCGPVADLTVVQALAEAERAVADVPAFKRDPKTIVSEGKLHFSHHLIFSAASEHLAVAESAEEAEPLLRWCLDTYDMYYGALHPEKAALYELQGKFKLQVGDPKAARLAFQMAWAVKKLSCGPHCKMTEQMQRYAQNPSAYA